MFLLYYEDPPWGAKHLGVFSTERLANEAKSRVFRDYEKAMGAYFKEAKENFEYGGSKNHEYRAAYDLKRSYERQKSLKFAKSLKVIELPLDETIPMKYEF